MLTPSAIPRLPRPPLRQYLYGGLLLTAVLTGLLANNLARPQPALAQTAASAISHNFETDQKDITNGMLVSLNKTANKVAPASSDNSDNLVGVVADTALVEIDGKPTQNSPQIKLQAVTNGLANTLVSDINGPIGIGDRITPSPIRGVGMRLTDNAQIIGVAEGNFSDVQTITREITGKDGAKTSIKIGRVPVYVEAGYYSGVAPASKSVPLIQRVANSIAGHETSTTRIAIAFALTVTGLIATLVLLRTAIANSLNSIGRNPLSADSIHKNFNTIALIAGGIMLVALITSYLSLAL